jgi:hypothetical protein
MNDLFSSKNVGAAIVCMASSLGLASPAAAQVVVSVAAPLPLVAPPPPVFVASAAPVYYEGRAAYWYGNRWVWRDHYGWHAYDREPVFLHEHRMHPVYVHPYRHYERRR